MARLLVAIAVLAFIAALVLVAGFTVKAFNGASSANARRKGINKDLKGYNFESYSAQFYALRVIPEVADRSFRVKIEPALRGGTSLDHVNLDFNRVFGTQSFRLTAHTALSKSDKYGFHNNREDISYDAIPVEEKAELYRLYIDTIRDKIDAHSRLQNRVSHVAEEGSPQRMLKKADHQRRALEQLNSKGDAEWDWFINKDNTNRDTA